MAGGIPAGTDNEPVNDVVLPGASASGDRQNGPFTNIVSSEYANMPPDATTTPLTVRVYDPEPEPQQIPSPYSSSIVSFSSSPTMPQYEYVRLADVPVVTTLLSDTRRKSHVVSVGY